MTDETAGKPAGDPKPVERAADKASAAALAGSSPDLAHNFIRVAEGMVGSDNKFKVASGTGLLSLLLFFTIGLSSMVGSALLWDKHNAGKELDLKIAESERGYQLQMFRLQTDLELQKLDKTQLGEGAMKTLTQIASSVNVIGTRLDAVAAKVDAQGEQIKAQQFESGRRFSSLAAQQQEMKDRMNQPARAPPR